NATLLRKYVDAVAVFRAPPLEIEGPTLHPRGEVIEIVAKIRGRLPGRPPIQFGGILGRKDLYLVDSKRRIIPSREQLGNSLAQNDVKGGLPHCHDCPHDERSIA